MSLYIAYSNRPDRVAQLAEHWASIPKVVGSNPTVARHIFQACPVWIYTQSNITQASYLSEYITPTQQHVVMIKSKVLAEHSKPKRQFAEWETSYY